jgi:hypothetical protein
MLPFAFMPFGQNRTGPVDGFSFKLLSYYAACGFE